MTNYLMKFNEKKKHDTHTNITYYYNKNNYGKNEEKLYAFVFQFNLLRSCKKKIDSLKEKRPKFELFSNLIVCF